MTEIEYLCKQLELARGDAGELFRLHRTYLADADEVSLAPAAAMLVRYLAEAGRPIAAVETGHTWLARHAASLELRLAMGLALERAGALPQAATLLEDTLADSLHEDLEDPALREEVLGQVAASYKRLAFQTGDPARADTYLQRALDLYQRAYSETGGYWSGINVATLQLLKGLDLRARETAEGLRAGLIAADGSAPDDYWGVATLGECALILGRIKEAQGWYLRAAELAVAGSRYGDLASTRDQALRIASRLGLEASLIEGWLPRPRALTVVAPFTLIESQPGDLAMLSDHPQVAFIALCSEAERKLAERLAQSGCKLTLVTPGPRESADLPRALLNAAERLVEASPRSRAPNDECRTHARFLALGLARLWCRSAGGELHALPSATGAMVADSGRCTPEVWGAQLQGFLFADFVGFSKFSDASLLHFVQVVMAELATLVDDAVDGLGEVLATNTWGDGLFIVFSTPAAAAAAALSLCNWLQCHAERFAELGFTQPLAARFALHAGPSTRLTDPFTGRPTYYGGHVSEAARLEPATPANTVYTTEAFAALAIDHLPEGIDLQFVGVVDWVKGYLGRITYRLQASPIAR